MVRSWIAAAAVVLSSAGTAAPPEVKKNATRARFDRLSANVDAPKRLLRVCADPNNLPFSNHRGEGFENKLAELIARELGAELRYTWWPQRRGFFRETLKAKKCDVVMGVPVELEMVATTAPYYRSTYVFVTRPDVAPPASFDSPELQKKRIGVTLVGDDGANPPPVVALARRNLIAQVRGYSAYGDYAQDSPPSEVVRAVSRGEVDLAIVWGPLAGYYAAREKPALRVTPLPVNEAPPDQPFTWAIAIGVRHPDKALKRELDAVLKKRRKEIAALLRAFNVPLVAE